ncbi:MAG: LacI family DNA-binding transcriptional regulator [Prevotellaceae bacterium]|nr:LacI family DNA-binding transcriptional regulator [Prevotellaceae bacterium]
MANGNASITMKDIARATGVSVATVSRALKNSPRISKEKRDEIQAYAREHDFSPNLIAESLRTSKIRPTKTIGVIIPEYTHYYFSSILSGIDQEASAKGYSLMVAQSGEMYKREAEICKKFFENKVCGVIVSQAKDTREYSHFERLISAGIPLIFYDRICTGVNASRVVVDDYQGAFNAVKHLIDTGCRHIAYFGSPKNLEISKNRFNGYCDALREAGLTIDERFQRICDNRPDAEQVAREILEQEEVPDAFFAVNDETAIGILTTAKRMGYRIPQDLSICGFTNSNNSTACDPTLTTVEQRGVEIGRQAANILISKVEGLIPEESVEKRIVRTRLIVRQSTR